MSVELETKLKVESHDEVRTALSASGATFVSRVLETNYILDSADGSLRRAGSALRVRAVETLEGARISATLTYKGPRQPSKLKTREERQVNVADADATLSILEAVGFVTRLTFEKKRETWKLEDCWVELDELPALGTFVEIEGSSEAAVEAVQSKIGLGHVPHIGRSYTTMLADWCRDHSVANRRVTFAAWTS